MSANADVLRRSEMTGSRAWGTALPEVGLLGKDHWNPEYFAREQIRGLVRQVFFAAGARPVKQVVFSAAEPDIDVAGICDQVGRALALETHSDIAIVRREQPQREMVRAHPHFGGGAGIKSRSSQIGINLWQIPEFEQQKCGEESGTGHYWLACLADLRNEFEYAVIHGPVAGVSSEAALLGQLADGIILVLGARSTRKASARRIKETLLAAQCRILGTVLSERTFPVPERIYRRL